MALPAWLEAALVELQHGVAEVPGPASNPRISEYLGDLKNPLEGDETSWCAAFVNWCLEKSGVGGTDMPNARSYLLWGQLSKPRLGAVTVLWRNNPTSWQGHVGFLLDDSPTSLYLLGGNQGDRVSVSAFPKDRLLGYRWPVG